jgi:preprotein translocase subunit SecE
MWGFKSLLPCQLYRRELAGGRNHYLDGVKAVFNMAQAAKLNKEEEGHQVSGFALLSPTGKIGQYPHRFRTFLEDVRVEMKKVNWPSREDVWSTTMVVVVTVTFFALYFFITDSLLSRAEDWLFHVVK